MLIKDYIISLEPSYYRSRLLNFMKEYSVWNDMTTEDFVKIDTIEFLKYRRIGRKTFDYIEKIIWRLEGKDKVEKNYLNKQILKRAIKDASLPVKICEIKDLHPTTLKEIERHIHLIQNILIAEYARYTSLKDELELR